MNGVDSGVPRAPTLGNRNGMTTITSLRTQKEPTHHDSLRLQFSVPNNFELMQEITAVLTLEGQEESYVCHANRTLLDQCDLPTTILYRRGGFIYSPHIFVSSHSTGNQSNSRYHSAQ